MTSPTPEERAKLRNRHWLPLLPKAARCRQCGSAWPCPTAKLLDALDAQDERVRQLEAALRTLERTAGHWQDAIERFGYVTATDELREARFDARAALANTQPGAATRGTDA